MLEDESRPTLTLISGNVELLDYCLSRFYFKDFSAFAKKVADAIIDKYFKPAEGSSFLRKLRAKVAPQEKS